ncbi:lysozyme family protein [Serratia proteamaculans]|uniref:hypothetical protein n=1 Tax=Serratia proteamaculans TaxID=28151 RepID=UPI0021773EF6|nr:hypothetical protein [Serratia proteamaculans]CAI1920866.1 Phage-related lysozyme (muraminidase) [Serratia proteamaculans]
MSDPNSGSGWGVSHTPFGDVRNYNPNEFGGNGGGGSGNNGSNGGNQSGTGAYSGRFNIGSFSADAPSLNNSELTDIFNNTLRWEGLSHNMYADTLGNVTIGIGSLLSTPEAATRLGFKNRRVTRGHGDELVGYVSASDADIRSGYQRVKDVFNNKSLNQRQKVAEWSGSAMVLNDAEIGSLAVKHINSDRTALRGLYAGFDSFPQSAKVALHDMAYNMGISRLRTNFPRFNDAVNRRDWAAAAAESHRTVIGDDRNNATRDQLLNAR